MIHDDELLLQKLAENLQSMKEMKTENRTERDRYIAIAITDLEKLIAFFDYYVVE
jgi:hypothetical protein